MQKRRCSILLLVLLICSLLPGAAFAEPDNNTLVIHKLANTTAVKDLNEDPGDGARPVAGAVYRIWTIGNIDRTTDQAGYDAQLREIAALSVNQLNSRYSDPAPLLSPPTDAEGITTVNGLADARYYVREVDPVSGEAILGGSLPFIIDLPFWTENGLLRVVDVYPKTGPVENDEPEGGERFRKVDEEGNGLGGAFFKLVVQAMDATGNPITDAQGRPVYESYLTAGKETILHSGPDGRYEIQGLPLGKYWLIETVSPSGYSILREPLPFEITETSYEDERIIRITNVKTPPNPPGVPPETPEKPPPTLPPGTPEEPNTPGTVTPPPTNTVTPPPSVTPSNPQTPTAKPPVTIPRTGDAQTYLYLAAGMAMIILGGWLIRESKA